MLLGSKITAYGDCSHEIKRCLLLGRKPVTHLDSILKSRDITLPTKVCLVKAMVFPVVMYGCESWTIKKAERQRIDAFTRTSNQSILKEISPEYSLEDWCWSWNSNTLATWWEELTHWKRPWCWERLKVGRKGDDRGWNGWMTSPTWWTWVWVSSGIWWWTGKPGVLQSMGSQRVGHDWATELSFNTRLTFNNLPGAVKTSDSRSTTVPLHLLTFLEQIGLSILFELRCIPKSFSFLVCFSNQQSDYLLTAVY